MGGAAAVRAVPEVKHAIALLVRNALAVHGDRVGRTMVPQAAGAPTDRAIALARVRWGFVEDQANSLTMAASVMLAHPRISSTGRAQVRALAARVSSAFT